MIRPLLLSSLAFWACLVLYPLATLLVYVAVLAVIVTAARVYERWPVWMLARRMPRAEARRG